MAPKREHRTQSEDKPQLSLRDVILGDEDDELAKILDKYAPQANHANSSPLQVELVPSNDDVATTMMDEEGIVPVASQTMEDGSVRIDLNSFTGHLILPAGVRLSPMSRHRNKLMASPQRSPAKKSQKSQPQDESDDGAQSSDDEHSAVHSERTTKVGGLSSPILTYGSPVKSSRCSAVARTSAQEFCPVPRWGASFTATQPGKLLLYGGESKHHADLLGDVHIYTINSNGSEGGSWSTPAGCEGAPTAWHTATFLPDTGHVLVFGGLTEDGETDACNVFDCDIGLWYPLTTSGLGPTARMGHSACALGKGERLFIFGGKSGRREMNDLYMLNTKTWRWTRPEPAGTKPRARVFHAAAAAGNHRMVVMGGRYGESNMLDDVHVLSEEVSGTLTWSSVVITGTYFRPRCGHVALSKPNSGAKLYITGGWDTAKEEVYDDVFLLDIDETHMTRPAHLEKMHKTSGHGAAIDANSDALVIFGGQTSAEAGEETITDELAFLKLSEASNKQEKKKKANTLTPFLISKKSSKAETANVTPMRDDEKVVQASSSTKRRITHRKLSQGGRTLKPRRFSTRSPPKLDLSDA